MEQVLVDKRENENECERVPQIVEGGDQPSTNETSRNVSRRRLIALLLGSAAAAAAAVSAPQIAHGGHDPNATTINDDANVFHLSAPGTTAVNTYGRAFLDVDAPGNSAMFIANSSNGSGSGLEAQAAAPGVSGITGSATSDGGIGVEGVGGLSGDARGVRGRTDSSEGVGVEGTATHPNGSTAGVRGRSDSEFGRGVEGISTSLNGQGVSGKGRIGVHGESLSPSESTPGIGVHGFADGPGLTEGVHGESESIEGTGVLGINPSESGTGVGVLGVTNSPDGIGVHATNRSVMTGEPGSGVGLRVEGRSQFNTILDGTILAGATSQTVADERINTNSEVMVILTGDPGKLLLANMGPLSAVKNGISWVNVIKGRFTVNLLAKAANSIPFRAFVVEKV